MNVSMCAESTLAFTFAEEAGQVNLSRLEQALSLVKSSLSFLPGIKPIGGVLNPPPAFGRKTPRSKFPARFSDETKCLWLVRIYPQEDRCTHFDGICRREGKDLLITDKGRLITWLYRYESMGCFEGRGCTLSLCRCNRPEEEGKISAFEWADKDILAALMQLDPSLEEQIIHELKQKVELYTMPPKGQTIAKDAASLQKTFANL